MNPMVSDTVDLQSPDDIALADKMNAGRQQIVTELKKIIVGQDEVIAQVLNTLFVGGNSLIVGAPGLAKTLLIHTMARVLDLKFSRIQFTPDLMPSDITGVNLLTGHGEFTFRPGPLFGDLILGDEINRAPAKTQAALLEAMQERSVTVDGVSHPLSQSFTVFATQNPIEFEGTYPLPEAELDRFLIKSLLNYPSEEAEQGVLRRVLDGFEAAEPSSFGVTRVLDANGLARLREAARSIRVEPGLQAYITSLVRATRGAPALTLGASPRASVALLKLSQAAALLDGRAYVVPDDVKINAPAVLRHRIAVAPELELEGVTADAALRTLIERIEAPTGGQQG
jgi:MoxR-like ATPase